MKKLLSIALIAVLLLVPGCSKKEPVTEVPPAADTTEVVIDSTSVE